MTDSQFEITKAATFDAAHFLQIGPESSRYRQMHGHSFRVEASVRGPVIEPDGWVADLADLDAALRALALESPTLEHICQYFADHLKPRFLGLSRIVVSRPSIGESCALTL